ERLALQCCPAVTPASLDDRRAAVAAARFKALADPTRLQILALLAANEERVCVCDINDGFALGQPTISHHLRVLRDAGLVSAERQAQQGAGCGCGSGGCCGAPAEVAMIEGGASAAGLAGLGYTAEQVAQLPAGAATASLGCGNPTALIELRAGQTVLDLGSGG